MVEVQQNHSRVRVETPDGGREEVLACEITEEDINDDGTVNTPVSGECECFDGMPSRKLFTGDNTKSLL